EAAMYEIDHFLPVVLNGGGWNHFMVRREGTKVIQYDVKSFDQIAYGRRPMIWAALQAYEMSIPKDKKYLDLACNLAMWFLGDNPAKANMYDIKTGRGYDGLNEKKEINRNAGAESTTEALLSLQAIEMHGARYDPSKKTFIRTQ
ncbi:MAG TPA: hypothetical protein VJ508_15180, partial [Saprospiraceae bacterium]|nr:hypothetical protein [Saprospiraceae bacterium]